MNPYPARAVQLALLLGLLVACQTTIEPFVIAEDHPASPAAQVTAPQAQFTALPPITFGNVDEDSAQQLIDQALDHAAVQEANPGSHAHDAQSEANPAASITAELPAGNAVMKKTNQEEPAHVHGH